MYYMLIQNLYVGSKSKNKSKQILFIVSTL